MRKAGIILGCVILILILIGIFVPFSINNYRSTIEAQLGQSLNRKVTVGQVTARLLPPRVRVQNPVIADDPAFQSHSPFIHADGLDASLHLLPLLGGNIEVAAVNLRHPDIELIRNANGVWNFSSFGHGQTSQGGKPLSINDLSIRNGLVAVTDLQKQQPRTVYNHIDVDLRDFAPGKQFTTDIAAHLPGPGTEQLRLQGKAGPLTDSLATTPFDGTLQVKQVNLAALKEFAGSPALAKTHGTVSGQTKIQSAGGKLTATGRLQLNRGIVNGVDLGYPVTADYKIADDLSQDHMTIDSATIKLGQTPIDITGSVDHRTAPAQVSLHIKSGDVSVTEVARLASAFGVVVAPGTRVDGIMAADVQVQGAATRPALNGNVSARDVKISGKEIRQPITISTVQFALTPTEIQSDNFQLVSGTTTASAHVVVQNYTAESPVINSEVRAPNATLPAALAMAKAYGFTGLNRISGGAGTVSADLRVAGPLRAISSAGLIHLLNGEVTLNLTNVRITGTSITHELGSIAGFLKPGQANPGLTDVSHVTGHIMIKNGVAQTNDLIAQIEGASISGRGSANLATEAINVRGTAVFGKDYTEQIGGINVGGYLKSALGNKQGELVVPFMITGTLNNPHYETDTQQIAQMRLKGLLPTSANPAAGVSGLLGSITGQKGGHQNSSSGQKPADEMNQILGNVLGGKK